MLGRDPQPLIVGKRMRGGGLEDASLLGKATDQAVGYFGDFFAPEDADELVDLGAVDQQRFFLSLGEAARDNHSAELALAFELEHFVDGAERFLPGLLNKAAGVDDGEVGALGVIHQLVTVELQHAEHPLAINQILGTAEADEGVSPLRAGAIGIGTVGGSHKRCLVEMEKARVPIGVMAGWAIPHHTRSTTAGTGAEITEPKPFQGESRQPEEPESRSRVCMRVGT
jgi:hypothetical protein